MAEIKAFPFQSPAVVILIDRLQAVLDDVPAGQLTVAEAVGALEIVKMELWADCRAAEVENG